MGDHGAAGLVRLARELEEGDESLAARIDLVSALLHRVDDVTSRSRHVHERLDAMPGEIAHAEQDELDARVREADARSELEEAERERDKVGRSRRAGEDALGRAERALRRAAIAATDAAAGATHARERLQALVTGEAALQAEAEALAVEAREVAHDVSAVSRLSESGRSVPGTSLEEIEEWGARAHAALFVVRGGLENERERIVLEANGLAAAALGDHAGGSSVALVRRRIEESLGEETRTTG